MTTLEKLKYIVVMEHDRPELHDDEEIDKRYKFRSEHCCNCDQKYDKEYLAKWGMCMSCYGKMVGVSY